MKTKDVRQAFSALRARTGLSSEAFADLLGLPPGAGLADYEYPHGTYGHAHLPEDLIERMLENLAGEGHPAITRGEILQLSLVEEAPEEDLVAQLICPSLLADILVAFDAAVEQNHRLTQASGVDAKARHTSILFKQLTTCAITSAEVEAIVDCEAAGANGRTGRAGAVDTMPQAQRDTILEELIARALLVELIEAKVEASDTVAFLGHLLRTGHEGRCLRQQSSAELNAIFDQVTAIVDAHKDPYFEEAENVVLLRDFRK